MDNQRRQRRYTIFAVFMVALMGMTAILPSLRSNTTTTNIEPTPTVIPTFPAPPADLGTITFDQVYVHPSGLYTVDYPKAWAPSRPSNNGTQVQVNFENTTAQSVIETYIEYPAAPVTTLQALSALYDDSTLQSGWRRYNSYQETAREIDTVNNAVVIDFELVLRGQVYLARHYAELKDNGQIYVTRVVTPSNARALLLDLLEKAKAAVKPVAIFADSPVAWNAYYSDKENLIVRYPSNWVQQDGAPGQPVTIENSGQSVLRVETVSGSAADADAASALVLAQHPDATVKTVQAVERNGSSGFEVAYTYRTLDGEPQSALAVILPDGENVLRVATVRVRNLDLDLLTTDDNSIKVTDAVKVAKTFNLTTGLGFPVSTDEAAAS